jgi:hypothetical protein
MSRTEIEICPCCDSEIECDCVPKCLEGKHDHECFYCQETLDDEGQEQEQEQEHGAESND